jgi:undecaprenyl-diphosphatase
VIEKLEHIDQELLLYLNSFHSDFMDQVMWLVSGKLEWIPLYLVLLYLLYKQYGKNIWMLLLGVGLSILMADQFSVKLFKEFFERYRPCHNLDIGEFVHLVNNKCGGKFGFVSSHAANSFALASYVGLLLRDRFKYALFLLLFWALLVSYSRVYLGVHYPADILGGGVLGFLIGFIVYKIYRGINNLIKKRL